MKKKDFLLSPEGEGTWSAQLLCSDCGAQGPQGESSPSPRLAERRAERLATVQHSWVRRKGTPLCLACWSKHWSPEMLHLAADHLVENGILTAVPTKKSSRRKKEKK